VVTWPLLTFVVYVFFRVDNSCHETEALFTICNFSLDDKLFLRKVETTKFGNNSECEKSAMTSLVSKKTSVFLDRFVNTVQRTV
jgi:hypothetical protein